MLPELIALVLLIFYRSLARCLWLEPSHYSPFCPGYQLHIPPVVNACQQAQAVLSPACFWQPYAMFCSLGLAYIPLFLALLSVWWLATSSQIISRVISCIPPPAACCTYLALHLNPQTGNSYCAHCRNHLSSKMSGEVVLGWNEGCLCTAPLLTSQALVKAAARTLWLCKMYYSLLDTSNLINKRIKQGVAENSKQAKSTKVVHHQLTGKRMFAS